MNKTPDDTIKTFEGKEELVNPSDITRGLEFLTSQIALGGTLTIDVKHSEKRTKISMKASGEFLDMEAGSSVETKTEFAEQATLVALAVETMMMGILRDIRNTQARKAGADA